MIAPHGLLCSRWPISLVCFRYVWVPGMLVHAIAWVRVVHVRRRRCLVVQRFDRSRSKPNNVRALRCPRLSALDVEHFDLESDPAPKKKRRTSCLITCCREGVCSVIGSLQMTVARAARLDCG